MKPSKFDEKTAMKFARAAGIDLKKIKKEREKIEFEKRNKVLTIGF